MSHVIYNLKSKHQYRTKAGSYWAERVAKSVFTKAVNAGKIKADEWAVASADEWNKMDEMVTVKALMTGADVQIRASQRGGCCDPSMELYYTM